MTRRTKLEELTWCEASLQGGRLLLVPLGSTEQHGPHLPLSTDSDIAEALCARAARRWPGTIVAPPLPYGASGEHQDFPGTVSIGCEALELLLVELCRSASASFPRIVLVSAHGGNEEPVARAVDRMRAEGREVRAWLPRWDGDAHAGRVETSLMLALAPELVRLAEAAAGNPRPVEELMPQLQREGVRAVSANGVLGDPGGASATEGRRLLEQAVSELVAAIDASAAPVGAGR